MKDNLKLLRIPATLVTIVAVVILSALIGRLEQNTYLNKNWPEQNLIR